MRLSATKTIVKTMPWHRLLRHILTNGNYVCVSSKCTKIVFAFRLFRIVLSELTGVRQHKMIVKSLKIQMDFELKNVEIVCLIFVKIFKSHFYTYFGSEGFANTIQPYIYIPILLSVKCKTFWNGNEFNNLNTVYFISHIQKWQLLKIQMKK